MEKWIVQATNKLKLNNNQLFGAWLISETKSYKSKQMCGVILINY